MADMQDAEKAKQPKDTKSLPVLTDFERWDYERLKQLEVDGLVALSDMREKEMTPEAIVEFIHQLSPWNLKTTGVSVLDAYVQLAQRTAPDTKQPQDVQERPKEERKKE